MKRIALLGLILLGWIENPEASRGLRARPHSTPVPTPPQSTTTGEGALTSPPPPSRQELAAKQELCRKDFENYNNALRLMTVRPRRQLDSHMENEPTQPPPTNTTAKYPRIFCYVNTIAAYHKTHAQLVADTWGQRCDKLVFFSNAVGTMVVNEGTEFEVEFPILKMDAPSDYNHLWLKHREVVKYMYDHYRHDYDWFYKADDDAYVVVDNLRDYLRRPEIMMNYKRQPMHLGKRFQLPEYQYRHCTQNDDAIAHFRKKFDRWIYNTGGPGYAMNRLFLDKFVASMQDQTCLSQRWAETSPEDTGTAYCMKWHNVEPWATEDTHGRPRWHGFNPGAVYGMNPAFSKGWWNDYMKPLGGVKWGEDCCAPDSIGYHYVKGQGMYHMERMLYYCRDPDAYDIATFNRKYGLAISDKVTTFH